MKKIFSLFVLLIIVFVLTACSHFNQYDNTLKTNPKHYRYQDNSHYFIETETGYYYMNPNGRGNIMFSEKGKYEFYLLCNKPNCSHSDTNCNAYAGEALGYYNQHLYSVTIDEGTSSFDLIQMDMDGSNHKKITRLPDQISSDGGTRCGGGTYFFDNGYLIMGLDPIAEDKNSKQKFYKISLQNGEKRLLFDGNIESEWTASYECSISSGKLYFVMTDKKKNESTLFEGDINNGEVTDQINNWSLYNSVPVNFDGKLYYYKSLVGFCEYDKNTKTETVMYPAHYFIAQAVYADDYILAKATPTIDDDEEPEWEFVVLDREYNLINKCELRKGYSGPEFDYYADNKAFFSSTANGKLTHYIDLSKAKKNLEMVEMNDPYSLR